MFISYDESIGMLLNHTNRKMVRYLNAGLDRYNITTEQWVVLVALYREDMINQKRLAENANKDQPTLVRILDILERKELIERRPSKEDRRSFLICLTGKGRSLHREVAPFMEDLIKKMVDGISKEDLDTFRRVLVRMSDNIT